MFIYYYSDLCYCGVFDCCACYQAFIEKFNKLTNGSK